MKPNVGEKAGVVLSAIFEAMISPNTPHKILYNV